MEHERAVQIRFEIDRLKRELLELEGVKLTEDQKTDAAAPMTCGQDMVIENLRTTARRFRQNGRAVLAGWQKSRAGSTSPWWYSTTLAPADVFFNIRSTENLLPVFKLFSRDHLLDVTGALFQDESGLTADEIGKKTATSSEDACSAAETLRAYGYVSESSGRYVLTLKGWQFFMVVAHLIWFQEIKVKPAIALKIIPAFMELYGIQWGEYLGKDSEDVLADLKESGWLSELAADGVTENDIRNAVYEHSREV